MRFISISNVYMHIVSIHQDGLILLQRQLHHEQLYFVTLSNMFPCQLQSEYDTYVLLVASSSEGC